MFGLLCFMLYCKKKHKKNVAPIPIPGLYNNLNEIIVLQPTYTCPSSPRKTVVYPIVPQLVFPVVPQQTVSFPEVPQQTVSFPKVPAQLSKVSSSCCFKMETILF